MAAATTEPGGYVPLREAAERLGISEPAARRRVKTGRLRGQRRPTAQGHVWYVWVPAADASAPTSDTSGDGTRQVSPDGSSVSGDTRERVGRPSSATLQPADRAEEMARYTEALLAPWRRRVEELAVENGRLQERLATAEACIAELQAPPSDTIVEEPETVAATPEVSEEEAPPALWWRRAWRWLSSPA
jgi:hypothetical protein